MPPSGPQTPNRNSIPPIEPVAIPAAISIGVGLSVAAFVMLFGFGWGMLRVRGSSVLLGVVYSLILA